jgi:hypothetical protein
VRPGWSCFRRTVLMGGRRLATSIAYWPRIVAEPPSELRRRAYTEGHDLLGPEDDPKGWQKLDPVTIKGSLFDAKEVEVTYEVGHKSC